MSSPATIERIETARLVCERLRMSTFRRSSASCKIHASPSGCGPGAAAERAGGDRRHSRPARSEVVGEKAGFVYEQQIVHVSLPHVLYRRRRSGRLKHRSSRALTPPNSLIPWSRRFL